MQRCSEGHWIPLDAPEQLCPRCLVGLPLAAAMPRSIGPFEVLEQLGEGGFGLVYRVRREPLGEDVALKVLRGWEFANSAAIAQFRREPTVSAKLKPEFVVRVLDVGAHAGVPYFTMEYMAGGTLRARLDDYRHDPVRAAKLMIQIATAVQYLHCDPERPERDPILHRDLKPENILFDGEGQPRISDFGIAKLARGAIWSVDTRPMGCPAYMAPEQMYPSGRRELTCAADVYALGAILYELFTGRPPFDGTDAEILIQLREREVEPPRRRLAPDLDRFLEAVVLSALEKDPARRYRSAAAFAQDLARALQKKEPEQAPPVTTAVRVGTWLRRHPLTAVAAAWLLSLSCLIGVSVRSIRAAEERELERDQQINASVAGMQAVAVNLQLQEYKRRIAALSEQAEVIALAMTAVDRNPSPLLLERLAPFDGMFVMGLDGRQRRRTSLMPDEYLRRKFDFRDYFKGAQRLAREVCEETRSSDRTGSARSAYLARAYTSESDGHFEFAISAPLCSERRWVGTLAATIASDKLLGAVRLLDDHHGRIAAVLGPRDRERNEKSLALQNDLNFIVHPGLVRGQALRLLQPEPARIRAALGIAVDGTADPNLGKLRYAPPFLVNDYRDPAPGFEGAWSAVFAAADESGYLVSVQSRRDATPFTRLLAEKVALPASILVAAGLLGLAFFGFKRRFA